MLADELDDVVGVDTHRDEHALAIVDARTGALVAQATTAGRRARLRGGAAVGGQTRARRTRVGCRGHRPPPCRPCALAAAQRRAGTRSRAHKPRRAAAARQGRSARRSPCRPLRTGNHAPRDAAAGSTRRRCGCSCSPDGVLSTRDASPSSSCAASSSPHRTSFATSYGDCRSVSCSSAAAASAARARAHPTSWRRSSSCAHSPAASRPRPREAETLEREILTHIRALVPQLLDEPGVGPIVAAQLIVTWSHHDRVVSEAAFARLAGVAPVPASSGLTTRHRLSRGGRPPTAPRSPHDRPPPPSTRPRNTRLHRPSCRRRQKHPRRRPPPQALPRPPPLPRHAELRTRDDLTVIGASFQDVVPGESRFPSSA